jgi:hypothetical protein
MRIVKVNSHHTHDVFMSCKYCGCRIISPAEWKDTSGTGYIPNIFTPRAYADLDAAPGTYYCRDCANDRDSASVSGVLPQGGVSCDKR